MLVLARRLFRALGRLADLEAALEGRGLPMRDLGWHKWSIAMIRWNLLLATLLLITAAVRADESTPMPQPEPAQQPQPPNEAAADTYFQGWVLSRDANKLREDGAAGEAEAKMVRALKLFRAVQKQWPEWKKEIVKRRLLQTEETLKDWGWKEDEVI